MCVKHRNENKADVVNVNKWGTGCKGSFIPFLQLFCEQEKFKIKLNTYSQTHEEKSTTYNPCYPPHTKKKKRKRFLQI